MDAVSINIDKITHQAITGWAARTHDSKPVRLIFAVNGVSMRQFTADIFRNDLRKIHEHGKLGFHIPLSAAFLESIPNTADCTISAADGGKTVSVKLPTTGHHAFQPENDLGEIRTLNKDGNFVVEFRNMSDATKAKAIASIQSLTAALNSDGTYPAFLTYGSLLGATREGCFIPHDDDIDLCIYLGEVGSKQEIEGLSLKLVEHLEKLGPRVERFSTGQLTITGSEPQIDLFLAWSRGEQFFMNFAINGEISTDEIFPLSTLVLEGAQLPAPRNPQKVCEAIYGQNWRTPDGNFRWTRDTVTDIVDRDKKLTLHYWNNAYKNVISDKRIPSQFATFVSNELDVYGKQLDLLLDVGCGNARDTINLKSPKYPVIGIDGSQTIVEINNSASLGISFVHCNFNDKKHVEELRKKINGSLAPSRNVTIAVYNRFFLHAIDAEAEKNFLDLLHQLTQSYSVCFFAEFRTLADSERDKVTTNHYRRFIDLPQLISQLAMAGLKTTYAVEGRGMAKYKADDAIVGRIVAESQ
jgi:SAM-dependent methyltransferase